MIQAQRISDPVSLVQAGIERGWIRVLPAPEPKVPLRRRRFRSERERKMAQIQAVRRWEKQHPEKCRQYKKTSYARYRLAHPLKNKRRPELAGLPLREYKRRYASLWREGKL